MMDLLPCPLCGSISVERDNKLPDGWIECLNCECEAPSDSWQNRNDEVIDLQNREIAALRKRLADLATMLHNVTKLSNEKV